MALISCENLSFSYEGIPAVQDLNFTVEKGDYLWILGENGAGKSTLIKGLLNLKKPAGGKIILGEGLIPNEIGYLPQQTVVQKDFPASVYEVVLSGCLNHLSFRPFYGLKERQRAKENMDRLGIISLKKRCYRDLSGGQQQRVLLARALCATKKLLILDEPVAGLDPVVTKELYNQIEEINQNLGITVIMVSHDINSAMKRGQKILHINGKQLFFGNCREYLDSEVGKIFTEGGAFSHV